MQLFLFEQAAIRDIEEILGTTILNAEDQSADVENGNDL